jgi:hypothetical protein
VGRKSAKLPIHELLQSVPENDTHEKPFNALLDDILVHIFSFLLWTELNEAVFISHLLAWISSSSSLNQI